MTRFRLNLAYEGTSFSGWAKQPGLRTVQGVLESVLALILHGVDSPPVLTVAGRTDTGVHASGQVAHVDLTPQQCAVLSARHGIPTPVPIATQLCRRLNAARGSATDVIVHDAFEVSPDFDARFSAVWRRYEYRIADRSALKDPLQRHRTAWVESHLDEHAMNRAAQSLVGFHDFASFCKAREGATTIRTLQKFSWDRDSSGVLIGSVIADAFCHSMVRSLTGACVASGRGMLDPTRLVLLRDECRRTSEFRVMPALGLTLCEVGYPDASELAHRAEQTRGLRRYDQGAP